MNRSIPTRCMIAVALFIALPLQAAQPRSGGKVAPPLGLSRLANDIAADHATPLVAAKFAVDDLSSTGVSDATKRSKDNVDYLEVPAGKEWSRLLRGSPRSPTFVSFQLYGSETTIVEIGGARLGLTAGPMRGSLQLMFDESAGGTMLWQSLKHHFSTSKYDGKNFAALPTLTVCLDPAANTWDLYVGSRLASVGLPMLAPKTDHRQFLLRAGSEGAWLGGLVMSDENPLYEDANANAIDDRFEHEKRGGALPVGATVAERKLLGERWRESQRTNPPPPLFVVRFMPDGAVVSASPKK